jgi:pantetheine-phosphate adenylyltransferase
MAKHRVGVYPGTFDPITNGHVDIITRVAMHLTDRLIIGVAENAGKSPLFDVNERVAMVQEEVVRISRDIEGVIEVMPFGNLLVDYAASVGADVVIRGLRAVSDFEYEFQMSAMNNRLAPAIETVFLMATDHNQFISSRLVKEVAKLGGEITHFVSPHVAEMVRRKLV